MLQGYQVHTVSSGEVMGMPDSELVFHQPLTPSQIGPE